MKKLLLVDDEPNVLHALRRTLTRAFAGRDLGVESFDDPEAALQRAAETGFDVVVSDFRMPTMDGVTFLRCFREIQPDATRLLLSAATDFDALVTAVNEVGIFRYLAKPWNDADFVETIEAALREHARTVATRELLEDAARAESLDEGELARQRLAEESPDLAKVNWGPDGSVIIDDNEQ